MFRRFGSLFIVLLSFFATLSAQTPDAASVHGQVIDQDRAAVAGAQIKVTNSLSGIERSAQSDSSGQFSLEGLPVAGTWTVRPALPMRRRRILFFRAVTLRTSRFS